MKSRFNLKPLRKALKEIFIPTTAQAALFISLSAIMLCVVFFDQIFKQLVGTDPKAEFYFQQTISDYLTSLSNVPFAEYVTNVLFWGLAGTAAYIIILIVFNMVISLRNNFLIRSEENLPGLFDSFSLVDEYRRIIWIFSFGAALFLTASSLAVPCFEAFKVGIVDLDILLLLSGVIFWSYNLYVLYMLAWTAIRNPNLLARN